MVAANMLACYLQASSQRVNVSGLKV